LNPAPSLSRPTLDTTKTNHQSSVAKPLIPANASNLSPASILILSWALFPLKSACAATFKRCISQILNLNAFSRLPASPSYTHRRTPPWVGMTTEECRESMSSSRSTGANGCVISWIYPSSLRRRAAHRAREDAGGAATFRSRECSTFSRRFSRMQTRLIDWPREALEHVAPPLTSSFADETD